MIDISKKKKLYFIGIGGISMSAIAFILKKDGHIVLGSDMSINDEVKKLRKEGITVNIGHDAKNISDDINVVVYSKAIHADNPEMVEAKKKGITIISRSELIGLIMKDFGKRICVAGTHGKTTTTAIISKVLLDQKFDPTINIGGIVDEIGGNVHIGKKKDTFILESCEYTNSFLDFYPTHMVITNIEEDHLDFFKDINDIRASFKKFIDKLPDGGLLVINEEIEKHEDLYKGKKIKIITYGESDKADYYISNIKYDDKNYLIYDIFTKKGKLTSIRQKLIGKHNALNSLASIVMLINLGIDIEDIRKSIEDFTGAKRRLEIKGEISGIKFMDDYAHHPHEIEASLSALKLLKYEHLYVIFEPHTYSRTKALFNDFVQALNGDFNLLLAPIYAAREIDDGTISSKNICNEIQKISLNKNNICEYFETFEKILEYVVKNAKKGDLIVTMGAGNVYKLYDMYKEKTSN